MNISNGYENIYDLLLIPLVPQEYASGDQGPPVEAYKGIAVGVRGLSEISKNI